MKIPIVTGTIERRIMINYRVEMSVLRRMLPAPFQPVGVDGYGIAGIDLIRFRKLRVKGLPAYFGYRSEHAAHRISVQWEEAGKTHRGLYVPRMDTDSFTTTVAGGRVFPGLHHRSKFEVEENEDTFQVQMQSRDRTALHLEARSRQGFPIESVFDDLQQASRFFARDRIAYSPRFRTSIFDGVELKCRRWNLEPLRVTDLSASFFQNQTLFPKGSVYFDHALLMREVAHEWHAHRELIASRPIRVAGVLL